ncbi:sulfoxide reductase heme-binding subunit YedZ [Crenobacter luteus]|uniref:sulfite oxidase heme-binding subunit YedZ n=1 Tax=Crenobacter luteus TaxID=1452487 RepID=UPI0010523719|nr:protein-methionine-sulfoxide reductase heme-binding subunit MsrQ [Crenobacter luteus]TCP13064.1 sulfoxide reductase heme-binding subunit YedZ [Crenobacter luteus]
MDAHSQALGGAARSSANEWLGRRLPWLKAALFLVCLLPLARAAWLLAAGEPTNPIEFITRSTGTWTLVMLLATLAVSPLRRATGWGQLLRLRRLLGLFAFFYASLHFTTYFWLDQFFDWAAIARDIVKRPFVTLGFAAFCLMLPLALTSTDAAMRRLKRRWGQLHALVYPLAVLAVLHYAWLVKKDLSQPLAYGAVLFVLLAERALRRWLASRRA